MLTLDSIVGTICRTKVSTNEEEELDFNTKYRKYSSDNCFVNLDSWIKNINKYYENADNLDEDEKPHAKTLREEEIEKVKERFSKRQKKVGEVTSY